MVTYYKIEEGYNSDNDRDEVWQTIKQVVAEIQENRQRIVDEVLRLEPEANRELIQVVAEFYRKPLRDLTNAEIRRRAKANEVNQSNH